MSDLTICAVGACMTVCYVTYAIVNRGFGDGGVLGVVMLALGTLLGVKVKPYLDNFLGREL